MSDEKKPRGPFIAEGTYRARAEWESVQFGWNRDRTAERASVSLRITGEGPMAGKSILWFGNFGNQEQIEYATRALKAMGWTEGPLGMPGTDEGCLGGLGSVDCEIVVAHSTFDGKTRAEVKFVNTIGGFAFKEALDGGALAALNMRVKRTMGATAPMKSSAHRPTHTRVPAPAGPATTGKLMSGIMSDEERARRIDQGDAPTRPEPQSEPEEDLPF